MREKVIRTNDSLPLKKYEEVIEKDTSKYVHISGLADNVRSEPGMDNIFLSKSRTGNIRLTTGRYLKLSGRTAGTSSSMGFFDGTIRTKREKTSLTLSNDIAWSNLKKVGDNMVFPEFRTPSEEALGKIKSYDAEIKRIQDEKQAFLNDVFMTLPLTTLGDIPAPFFTQPYNADVLGAILQELCHGIKTEVKE